MTTTICQSCGLESTDSGAVYCAGCGQRIGGGACSCGAEIPSGASFCPRCGGEVESRSAPDMGRRGARRRDAGIRWVRGEREVATRIEPSDLEGRLRSGLEVQPGTRALFFVGGAYVATLPPGGHTLESIGQKLRMKVKDLVADRGQPSAIVVDDGELGVEFSIDGLRSSDPHHVVLHAQASVRLADPEVFIANLFRDRGRFRVDELAEMLAGEMRQTLRELVARHSAEDLFRGRVRAELEMELISRWKTTLDRTGFVLNRFRVLDFELPGLEEAADARADARDAILAREAQREGREVFVDDELADFRLDTEIRRRRGEAEAEREEVDVDLELSKLERDVERLQKRNPLLDRLLREGMLERMTELESDEEWRKFRMKFDHERLLDETEWKELRRDTEQKSAQKEVQRQFVFQRVKALAQSDLEELRLKQKSRLKLLETRGDTDVTAEEIRQERTRLDAELENRRSVFEQELDEERRRMNLELDEARSAADLQLYKVERMETIRQMAKDRDAARKLDEQVKLAEIEAKRFAQEADMYGMMSTEQILATAVARNPGEANQISEAFRAMKSGEATERERQLYERMLSEVKEAHQTSQRLDHDKFRMTTEADSRVRAGREAQHEQEKERLQSMAVAGLTADDKKRVPWRFCEVHGIKYSAQTDCPLCTRERAADS